MKCGVIIDTSNNKDVECQQDAVLSNEGVELCVNHANAYEANGLLTSDSASYLADLRKYPASFTRGDKVRIDNAYSRFHGTTGIVIAHIGDYTRVKLDKSAIGSIEPGWMWFPWGYLVIDRSCVRYSRKHAGNDGWCVGEFHEGIGWVCGIHTGHLSLWEVLKGYLSFADEIRGGYPGCARLIGPGGIIAAEEDGRRKASDASREAAAVRRTMAPI